LRTVLTVVHAQRQTNRLVQYLRTADNEFSGQRRSRAVRVVRTFSDNSSGQFSALCRYSFARQISVYDLALAVRRRHHVLEMRHAKKYPTIIYTVIPDTSGTGNAIQYKLRLLKRLTKRSASTMKCKH